MSKAVLISIRPKWVEKIANGEKTIEVRKTRPKLTPPFKVYIYCSQGRDARRLRGSWGKVIGEFTCNHVANFFANSRFWLCEDDVLHTCLSADEIRKYANGANELYGWHISNLMIYAEPREMTEFRRACPNSWYCESCAMYWGNNGTCGNESLHIKRPPQSWCYVEEIDMDHEAAEELCRLCRDYDLGRLEKLIEADKDGRLVVKPCKVGDTLYRVFNGKILEYQVRNMRYLEIQGRWDIDTTPFCPYVESSIGKDIFLTREEAEKALEAMWDG